MGNILFGEDISCESALEFIEAISPIGKNFVTQGNHWWLFRGQAQDWPIRAAALRKEAKLHEYFGVLKAEPREYATQCSLEKRIVLEFFRLADHSGLRLPEDSQLLREVLQHSSAIDFQTWPPINVLSLLGLAQHHGVPTRLIDWSWNPYVAAYFAARKAADLLDEGTIDESCEMEVSGISSLLSNPEFMEKELFITFPNYRLELVTAPTSENTNLRAQEGVFLMLRPLEPIGDDPVNIPCLETFLHTAQTIPGSASIGMLMTFRATLQAAKAKELLYFLKKLGYSRSRIFPSYEGVAAELNERRRTT